MTLSFHGCLPTRRRSLSLALVVGIALEWYQTTVPGRYGSITDILLNSLGAALGIVIALFLL